MVSRAYLSGSVSARSRVKGRGSPRFALQSVPATGIEHSPLVPAHVPATTTVTEALCVPLDPTVIA